MQSKLNFSYPPAMVYNAACSGNLHLKKQYLCPSPSLFVDWCHSHSTRTFFKFLLQIYVNASFFEETSKLIENMTQKVGTVINLVKSCGYLIRFHLNQPHSIHPCFDSTPFNSTLLNPIQFIPASTQLPLTQPHSTKSNQLQSIQINSFQNNLIHVNRPPTQELIHVVENISSPMVNLILISGFTTID